MDLRAAFRDVARGPGRALYGWSAPVLRGLCQVPAGRTGVELLMRGGGRLLLWAFRAAPQASAQAAQAEWRRVLAGIGLQAADLPAADPLAADSNACTTCFARCTLDLKPGDSRTCDAVMAINDEMLRKLGGRMRIRERLTDEGASRCVVTVEEPGPGEAPLWCDEAQARGHFDQVAGFYDWIMGYYEIPTNRRALRLLLRRARAPRTALDLGAGTGLSTRALLRALPAEASVVALDQSPAMLARTRARADDARLTLRRCDAASTGLPTASMDVIYSSFLLDLHDAPRRAAILAEARRLLRPGGVACFAVMDGEAPRRHDQALSALYSAGYGRWNPLWMALCQGYAPHCRPVRLSAQLAQAGLRVVQRARSYVTCFPVAIYVVQRLD